MSFFTQIRLETVNMLRSKFILIMAIIVLLASVAVPVLGLLNNNESSTMPGGVVYAEKAGATVNNEIPDIIGGKYSDEDESIEIGGVSILPENPSYWNIYNLLNERDESANNDTPAVAELKTGFINKLLEVYVNFAKNISSYEDYRYQLVWDVESKMCDLYCYQYEGTDATSLFLALQNHCWMSENDFNAKYITVSAQDRIEAIDKLETYFSDLSKIVVDGDFATYVAMMIDQQNNQIASLELEIATLERSIIDNPENEEDISRTIDNLKSNIANIKNNAIPIWEYRLEKNIIPYSDTWQNRALDSIVNCGDQLSYTKAVTEKEFLKSPWMINQYGTYAKYTASIEKQINDLNNKIIIARRSVDADKPDMSFVPDGARTATVNFLYYSVIVTMFAIMAGGWIIASEFQSGTIRLLLIRPRVRSKVLMSKYLAALLVCLVIYIVGCLLNLLLNGAIRGFADFANPNYTVTSTVGFIGYYIPKMLCCMLTILAGLSFAFMLSTVVKNSAVAIAVPIIIFVASYIVNAISPFTGSMNWVVYSPFPYMDMSAYFISNSAISNMIQGGMQLSAITAVCVLVAITAASLAISLAVFNKRDVTN